MLIWFGDKQKTLNYQPKADEMILTVHRWFANKSCPGDWMYARMGNLAQKVTVALGGTAVVPDEKPAKDTERQIWDYFFGRIGNAYGAAGLMGNLFAESGLHPNNLQNSYNKKLNITDEEYTRLVDDGNYPEFIADKAGYGLAQWTFWSRKQALLDFAKDRGVSIADLQMQLDFMWKELNDSHPAVLIVLKEAKSVREASDAVLMWYEKPADQSEAVQAKRAGYGQGYFEKYAGGEVSEGGQTDKPQKVPFLVRVTATDLNIRKRPGTDTAKTGKYTDAGVFTIVEVRRGKGSKTGWGKLKSGAGWISLDYCQRV